MEEEIELIHSPLCRKVQSEGQTVNVEIYSSGKNDWILEVVDAHGNSTVWDRAFDSDEEALSEFTRTLKEEGIKSMVGTPE